MKNIMSINETIKCVCEIRQSEKIFGEENRQTKSSVTSDNVLMLIKAIKPNDCFNFQ